MMIAMNRKSFLRRLTLSAAAVSAGCSSTRVPPSGREFTVLTYNIHHGEGRDGRLDLIRIAEVIRSSGADLVALQEVDRLAQRTQGRDLPKELAALTSMEVIFGPNIPLQGGEYGNAILSRFPVARWTNLRYRPVRPGEQRGLLQSVVTIDGSELAFLCTHLDHRPDDVERLASVAEIETVAAQYASLPLVLCGDFNDQPGSRTDVRLSQSFRDAWRIAGTGNGGTYPSEAPTRRIDYVWLKGAVQAVSAEVLTSDGSDHAALKVRLRLGR